MMTTRENNNASMQKRSMSAMLAAAFWILESCMGCLPEALAQRNGAEPEADPQFQQDIQASAPSSGGGQPIENLQPASTQGPAVLERPAPVVPSVQIGGVPEKRAAQPVASNPLDVKISVRVRDASLATFLEIISNQAKVNFIVTEGVRNKTVTAFLQNVTVREALQILLEIKGLTYQQIGKSNSYIIRERTKDIPLKITRVYTLNFAPLVPIFNSQQGSSGGQSGQLGGSAFGQSGGGGITSGISGGSFPGAGNSGSQFNADSGISIYQNIKSILTKEGQIGVDPRTNSLVITDIPEVFPQVEQIIAELDKKAPQVIIEAQIVEIDSDKTKNLGLEWGGADGTLATFTGPQRDTAFPLNLPNNLSKTQFFGHLTNVVSSIGTATGGSGNNTAAQTAGNTTVINNPVLTGSNLKTGIVDLSQLSVVLRALVANSEARFLGKPKVLTLNNKTATIEVVQDQAVANLTNITAANGGVSQATTTVERHQTGVRLLVTPQVNKEGYITLLVQPQFASVVQSALSSAANPVFDPLTRSENTLVRVKNGQTLVLGGLLSSTETKAVRKVPFFGYIPLLGWLFTSSNLQRHNTDLVIFLTPTVVDD